MPYTHNTPRLFALILNIKKNRKQKNKNENKNKTNKMINNEKVQKVKKPKRIYVKE